MNEETNLIAICKRIDKLEKAVDKDEIKKDKPTSEWEENLKAEFGIHFKNSPDELKFLEAFIEELLAQAKSEVRQEIGKEIEFNSNDLQEIGNELWDKDFDPDTACLLKLADIINDKIKQKLL